MDESMNIYEWWSNFKKTYKVIVSFHSGFKHDLIVFVFFLIPSVSGINFSFT